MAWQWVEFLHSVVDSSYVPEVYRKAAPANATKDDLRKLSKEAHEYNKTAQTTAKYTEMPIGTLVKAPILVADALAFIPGAVALIDPEPITKGAAAALAAAPLALEGEASYVLHNSGNNHAPLQTVFNTYIPPWVPLIGGDRHYYEGGSAIDHPLARIEPPSNKNPLSHVPLINLFFESQEDAADKQAIKRLIRNGGSELTLDDLDRNGDGVLTAKDAVMVRQALGNDETADKLFKQLKEQGITFDGKIGAAPAANASSGAPGTNASHTGSSTNTPGTGNTNGNEPGYWGNLLAALVDLIKTIFGGSSEQSSQVTTSSNPARQAQPTVMVPQGLPNRLGAAVQR